MEKIAFKVLGGGSPARNFRILLNELSTIIRNTCRRRDAHATEQTSEIDTTPNAK